MICSNAMRNFRFAIVAGAALLSGAVGVQADNASARELIGTSFHWEQRGTPYTLVLVSENTAWWISEGVRFRTISTGEPWRIEGRNKLIWSRMRFQPLEIQIRGSRFSMGLPGAPQLPLEGRVSRPKK
jgi:hypothetical protein